MKKGRLIILDGSMSFNFGSSVSHTIKRLGAGDNLVIDISKHPYPEEGLLFAIEGVCKLLHIKGVVIWICGINRDWLERLRSCKLVPEFVPRSHLAHSLAKAIAKISSLHGGNCASAAFNH
ncbi:MAG: hypothetical protein D6808_03680 [Candidatus Dadabacteria bacterium]|nr:MAG: hypothetical protein D6808_03680 [Candidatus Dadabacteria bacterium]